MTEIIKHIEDTKDDAMENQSWCYWEFSADEVYYEGPEGWFAVSGLRYQLNIPPGAIIDSAILALYTAWASTADFNIFAHAIDNSENFEDNNHIISEVFRPRTTAFKEWIGTYAGGAYQDSPDIKDVIQEIIDRPGWTTNNWLTLLLIYTGVLYKYFAFQDWNYSYSSLYTARLTINYHVPPIYLPNKQAFSGYHCFMEQYIKNTEAGTDAYKLPNGTLW